MKTLLAHTQNFLMGILIIFLVILSPIVRADWQPTRYEMDIRVDYQEGKIYASCLLTVINVSESKQDHVPLMLYRLLKVSSVSTPEGHLLTYEQKYAIVENQPKLQVNAISVKLPQQINPGEEYSFLLTYDGYIFGYTEAVGPYVREKIEEPYTILREETNAYPHVGLPIDSALRQVIFFSYDYKVTVEVPDHLVVANGGKQISKHSKNGVTRYTYENIKSAWRMDFAIADYDIHEDGGFTVYTFKMDSVNVSRVLNTANRALALYSEWFGLLKDFENFSIIQIPDGYGSQADVTSILQTSIEFQNESSSIGLYHELAHLWHPLPKRVYSSRWNEGHAMFLQYLAYEILDDNPGILDRAALFMREDFVRRCKATAECINTPLVDYGKKRMTAFSYNKGMVMFYILYNLIGQEFFNQLFRNYYLQYYETGGAVEDLVDMILVIPHKGLSQFTEEWFFGTESNRLLLSDQSLDEVIERYNK